MFLTINELKQQLGPKKRGLNSPMTVTFCGVQVRVRFSLRFRMVMANKKNDCAYCGAKAIGFVLGKYYPTGQLKKIGDAQPIMYLEAVRRDGKKTVITVDHIIPKAKGGTNDPTNLQPLCQECDSRKSDYMPSEVFLGKKWWKNITSEMVK